MIATSFTLLAIEKAVLVPKPQPWHRERLFIPSNQKKNISYSNHLPSTNKCVTVSVFFYAALLLTTNPHLRISWTREPHHWVILMGRPLNRKKSERTPGMLAAALFVFFHFSYLVHPNTCSGVVRKSLKFNIYPCTLAQVGFGCKKAPKLGLIICAIVLEIWYMQPIRNTLSGMKKKGLVCHNCEESFSAVLHSRVM